MRKLISVLFIFFTLASYSQTPLTFTPLGTEFLAWNRGPQNWGLHPWNNITQITYPGSNSVAKNYYTRFNWRDIESSTVQGSYSWTVFDNFVNQAIDAGATFSFGLMAVCNGCGTGGQIPAYVQTLMTGEGKPGPTISGDVYPNYQSTNWKTRYAALMHAVANHIASTSRSGKTYTSAFVGYDIRHYSEFGEGTGFPTGGGAGQCPSTAQLTNLYMMSMIDSTIAIFPNVQLTIPMEYVVPADLADNSDYSLTLGHVTLQAAYYILTSSNSFGRIGWRRDNLGDKGYNRWFTGNTATYNPGSGSLSMATLILNQWKYATIGGEPSTSLGGVTTTSGCSSTNLYCDFHNEDTLLHLTYFGNGNAPGGISSSSGASWTNMVANWTAAADEQGYDISLTGGTISSAPRIGQPFNISPTWKNAGLAPVYERWNIIYEFRNTSTGAVVWRDTSDFSLRLFLPTTTDSTYTGDTYTLPVFTPGTYNLHMIIKDPAGYKTPFQMSITGRQADGSYILKSNVVVTAPCVTYAVGTPGGSLSITSMGSYNPCDIIKINTGTYTSATFTNLTGLEITSQNVATPVTFQRLSTFNNNKGTTIHDIRWVSDLKTGSAWTMSGGGLSNNTYYNIYWQDWPSSVITMHNNIQYDYVDTATAIGYFETIHDFILDSCGQFMQGSFGDPNSGGTTAPDVWVGLTVYNGQDIATSLQGGNGQGTGIRGICYHCTVHDVYITDRSGRGADGDVGWIYGSGAYHVWNVYKWGGPGYLLRLNGPMSEGRDAWDNWLTQCGKFGSTQYGFANYQFNGGDTIAGKTYGPNSYVFNNTYGNAFNDTLGYWSTMLNFGQITPATNTANRPGGHYYAKNNLAFNVGNNPQRAAAGGQPNNAKNQMAVNLGGWNTIGTDTSNNKYAYSETIFKLDSTTAAYTNRIGTFYYNKPTSVSTLVNGQGTSNPISTVDFVGFPLTTPPGIGYLQFNGAIVPNCNCFILRAGPKRIF